jgi:hypothetical protein
VSLRRSWWRIASRRMVGVRPGRNDDPQPGRPIRLVA